MDASEADAESHVGRTFRSAENWIDDEPTATDCRDRRDGAARHHLRQQSPTLPTLPATLSFTTSPIDAFEYQHHAARQSDPPGHTIPTDHIYFYHRLAVPVVVPAGGTVFWARRGKDVAVCECGGA
jgi:hypothetical protein